jgi:hypothetical protein
LLLQDRLNSFSFLLLVSLLLHGLLAAAVLWQQRRHVEKPATPAALRVFAVAATALRPAPVTPPAVTVAAPATPAVVTPAARLQAKGPARQAAIRVRTNATPSNPRSAKHKATPSAEPPQPPQPPQPASSPKSQATTTPAPDLEQILSNARQNAASALLSDAELQALTITPSRRTAGPVATVRRPQVKPGSGPAGDVLETLADGRQLVRVGKGCVLADAGADLRKNIHSMRIVACGAGGRSEQDRIDAHFEQVMSATGSHR